MTIEQTVVVPASRLVQFSPKIPVGRFRVFFVPEPETEAPAIPLLELRGSCKGEDTMEAYFARHHADNERERGR